MLDAHPTGKHANAGEGMTKDELNTRLAELGEMFLLMKNSGKLQYLLDEGGRELLEVCHSTATKLGQYQLKSESILNLCRKIG